MPWALQKFENDVDKKLTEPIVIPYNADRWTFTHHNKRIRLEPLPLLTQAMYHTKSFQRFFSLHFHHEMQWRSEQNYQPFIKLELNGK